MSPPSLHFNLSQVKYSTMLLPLLKTVLVWTLLRMGSGGEGWSVNFFDVRVFNAHAPSNQRHHPSASYRHHENLKKRAYEQCIRDVEDGSFTPLLFSVTGGLGRIAPTTTYKRLASMPSSKHDLPYFTTMAWLRCRLSLCFGPPFK